MNITRTVIECVRITGPMAETRKALDYCARNGYRVTRSGPYRRIDRIGRPVDTTRYLITAERKANDAS